MSTTAAHLQGPAHLIPPQGLHHHRCNTLLPAAAAVLHIHREAGAAALLTLQAAAAAAPEVPIPQAEAIAQVHPQPDLPPLLRHLPPQAEAHQAEEGKHENLYGL